jgi:hypothetical protein
MAGSCPGSERCSHVDRTASERVARCCGCRRHRGWPSAPRYRRRRAGQPTRRLIPRDRPSLAARWCAYRVLGDERATCDTQLAENQVPGGKGVPRTGGSRRFCPPNRPPAWVWRTQATETPVRPSLRSPPVRASARHRVLACPLRIGSGHPDHRKPAIYGPASEPGTRDRGRAPAGWPSRPPPTDPTRSPPVRATYGSSRRPHLRPAARREPRAGRNECASTVRFTSLLSAKPTPGVGMADTSDGAGSGQRPWTAGCGPGDARSNSSRA